MSDNREEINLNTYYSGSGKKKYKKRKKPSKFVKWWKSLEKWKKITYSIIAGVLAIVFFVISKNKGTSNGMALAGLICAIFGILLGILCFSMVIFMFDDIFSMMEDAMNSTTELL